MYVIGMVIIACEPSSPERSGGGEGKRRRPCNYVSGICIEKVDAKY